MFQACCDRLAVRIADLKGPAVMVAMAETATGLGHGIFESWLRHTGRNDLLFLHGTRYALALPPALTFDELHSHATRHRLYAPTAADDRLLFNTAHTLVIVDDEMSTGATAANLAAAYRQHNPALRQVIVVCLTDWLNDASRAAVTRRVGVSVRFESLLRGTYSFEPDQAFDPGPPPFVDSNDQDKTYCLPANFGRVGLRTELQLNESALVAEANLLPGTRLLVLGTGEFHYPAFRLARWLELQGWDVMFQSTTRSPLLVDGDLNSVLEFVDNYHEGIPNFLYNVVDRHYDRVLVGYETDPLPTEHRLCEILGACGISFGIPASSVIEPLLIERS